MGRRSTRGVLAAVLVACACLTLNGCFAAPTLSAEASAAAEIEHDLTAFLAGGDQARRVRAVLVYHDGRPVLERYTGAGPSQYWDTRSVTKSVMSTLVGIAIDQGLISGVDATLGELLPPFAADMTPAVAAITLEQLLTETGGVPRDPSADKIIWQSPDWTRAILVQWGTARPRAGQFRYSDEGSHLLSAILVQATGRSVLEFAREYLFEPLEIPAEPASDVVLGTGGPGGGREAIMAFNSAGFAWPVDPQGLNTGSAFLKLRPKDLAAIGLAYLGWGQSSRGVRVIPEDWITAATSPRVESAYGDFGCGYLWWTLDADGAPAYAAFDRGQLIEVVPDRGLVVVVASEYDELDPLRDLNGLSPGALTEAVSTWIAPLFPSDGAAEPSR